MNGTATLKKRKTPRRDPTKIGGSALKQNTCREVLMVPDHDSLDDACPLTDWNTSFDKAKCVGKVRIEYFFGRDLNVPEGIELVLTTEQVTQMRQSLQKLEADLRANPTQIPTETKSSS